jgi:hypothetical protein
MTCALIGDSLAMPAGLGSRFPQCEVRAHKGWPSRSIVKLAGGSFTWAVISAGSNDPGNPDLRANLETIRSRIHADRFVWVVPCDARAAWTVVAVAGFHGDGMASFAPRGDGVHPRSYEALARSVRGAT